MKNIIICALFLIVTSTTASTQSLEVYTKSDSVIRFDVSQIDSLTFTPCDTALILNLLSPAESCTGGIPTRPSDPRRFDWEIKGPAPRRDDISFNLTLVEVSDAQDIRTAIINNKPIIRQTGIKETFLPFDKWTPVSATAYAWQVDAVVKGEVITRSDPAGFAYNNPPFPIDIAEVLCCKNPVLSNGGFTEGATTGSLPIGTGTSVGSATGWFAGYGHPSIVVKDDGCSDENYVALSGTQTGGDCIAQKLQPSNRIIQGQHYRASFCVRVTPRSANSTKYVKVGILAYNNTLPSIGIHPQPSSDIAFVEESGIVTEDSVWTTVILDVWTANKNFDYIGLYARSLSPDSLAECEIDNVCFQISSDSVSCDDYDYDSTGAPIIPSGLQPYLAKSISTEDGGTFYRGRVSDLYPSGAYTLNDPCASIGGSLPELPNLDDSLAIDGISRTATDSLVDNGYNYDPPIDTILQGTTFNYVQFRGQGCPPFKPDPSQPFGGRDIIFVHGLMLSHLCDSASGVPGAGGTWPGYPNEYKHVGNSVGYYKQQAEATWADHIQTFLTSQNAKNRYFIVSYNCNQRLPFAVHALLHQVGRAMTTGEDVVYAKSDPRKNQCFGQNAVIISHSTGGLVTDVALSIANKTKTDPQLRAIFGGDWGYIPDNIRTHIAEASAIGGSNLAGIVIGANLDPTNPNGIGVLGKLINSQVGDQAVPCSVPYLVTPGRSALGSILVDLRPRNAYGMWGNDINSVPVPVLTVNGAHHNALTKYLKYFVLPGLDDGVESMGGSSGNPYPESNLSFPTHIGYFGGPNFRVFDMGMLCDFPMKDSWIPPASTPRGQRRSIGYYLDQKTLFTASSFWAGTSHPFLSPDGMVQPVSSFGTDTYPGRRRANHYSFLISGSDHYSGFRGKRDKEGYDTSDPANTTGFQPPAYAYADENDWESLAIMPESESFLYSSGLLNPQLASMQIERIAYWRKTICFRIPWIKFVKWKPQFTWKKICLPPIYFWKRKYHNAEGWETKGLNHYVYQYVLR